MFLVGRPRRSLIPLVALLVPLLTVACTLLAPSDEELMGGLSKGDGGGDGASEGGDAAKDSGTPPPPCDAGGGGASCQTGNDCCSGKCKGNGQCL